MDQVFQQIQESIWTPPWLADVRQRAFERFKAEGWPSRSDENWRYTSTRELAKGRYELNGQDKPVFDAAWREHYLPEAYRLVFVDGSYVPEESLTPSDEGVTVLPLSLAMKAAQPDLVAGLLRPSPTSLGALNQALFGSGAYVRIARHLKLGRPLQILHIQPPRPQEDAPLRLSSPRHVIELQEGAEAIILESYPALGDAPFTNAWSDIHVAAGARLTFVSENLLGPRAMQVNQCQVRVARDARCDTFTLNLGGQLNRHELRVELLAPGATVRFDGLYIGRDASHIDMNTSVVHAAPHTTSSQVYKGILYDRARSVFDGKISIIEDAQQSRADQLNKNLLLSNEAEVDTKPQLRIDADDVKCSHGATVGRLDRNELFYLQSRGIDRETGESLLSAAFVRDVLGRLQDEGLEQRLERQLSRYSGEEAST